MNLPQREISRGGLGSTRRVSVRWPRWLTWRRLPWAPLRKGQASHGPRCGSFRTPSGRSCIRSRAGGALPRPSWTITESRLGARPRLSSSSFAAPERLFTGEPSGTSGFPGGLSEALRGYGSWRGSSFFLDRQLECSSIFPVDPAEIDFWERAPQVHFPAALRSKLTRHVPDPRRSLILTSLPVHASTPRPPLR
ncbi:MAG: hypothetical protein ACJA2W_002727 [Planctomycetota bacterium]|jgi:hypothetical protein